MSNDRYRVALLRIAAASHNYGTGGPDRLRYHRMACEALGLPVDLTQDGLTNLRSALASSEAIHEAHHDRQGTEALVWDWRLYGWRRKTLAEGADYCRVGTGLDGLPMCVPSEEERSDG